MTHVENLEEMLKEYGNVLVEEDASDKYSLLGEEYSSSERDKPLRKYTQCPMCKSSDAGAVYPKNFYCFSCGKSLRFRGKEHREAFVVDQLNTKIQQDEDGTNKEETKTMSSVESKKVSASAEGYRSGKRGTYSKVEERNLTKSTCEKYLIRTVRTEAGHPRGYIFGYCKEDKDTGAWVETAAKLRAKGDKSKIVWDNKPKEGRGLGLFGQHAFPPGCAKAITITEGEWDAPSVSQMSGGYPAVSIPDGAAVTGVINALKPHLEYLSTFKDIVICFDNDGPGVKAASKAAELLTLGTESNIKILRLSENVKGVDKQLKDANDYNVAGLKDEFIKQWWNAEKFTPEYIVSGNNLKKRIFEMSLTKGIPYPWKGVNDITRGQRAGELVLWAAVRGVGKSTVARQIALHTLKSAPTIKIGTLFLEESPGESGLKCMSIHANKNLHSRGDTDFDDDEATGERSEEEKKELDKVFDECLADDRMFFYDFTKGERGTSLDKIKARIRYYAIGLGCKVIIVDHVGIVASASGRSDAGELDKIAQELARLATELGVTIHLTAHLNREGKVRGSDGPENSAHIVFHMYRDVAGNDESLDEEEGKRYTIVHCTKQRNEGEKAGRKVLLKCPEGEQALKEVPFEELPSREGKTKTSQDELDSMLNMV